MKMKTVMYLFQKRKYVGNSFGCKAEKCRLLVDPKFSIGLNLFWRNGRQTRNVLLLDRGIILPLIGLLRIGECTTYYVKVHPRGLRNGYFMNNIKSKNINVLAVSCAMVKMAVKS